MKKKEFQEYKNKSENELLKDFALYRERLANLKFDLAAGKVKNIREIRAIKKTIARILTLLK
jgi:ribosomal protein L29